MIDIVIEIPEYGWRVNFHCAVSCYHTDDIVRELRGLDCPQMYLKSAYDLMSGCRYNKGITYSNVGERESVVVVGLASSAAEFSSSLSHEVRHLVDDIVVGSKWYDKEEVAYLTGDIHKRLYPYVKGLLCDGCREKQNTTPECGRVYRLS